MGFCPFMASRGNSAARAVFESRVPPFYYRPSASDCQLLREQWIRAKYERQEFTHPERQEPYSAGYREGFLWKRGRDNGQFLSRKFVLTEREGALKYFNRSDAKEPKAVMKIEHLNATFQPAKIGHPHGLQVTYLKDNSTRNIFVYHEDGKPLTPRRWWTGSTRSVPPASTTCRWPSRGPATQTWCRSSPGTTFRKATWRRRGPSRRKASGSAGSPWTTAGSCTSKTPWTPSPAGRSSSAAGRAATRCWTGSRRPPRATTGRTASRSSRPSAGSCWPVRRSRSSGPGWRPSARWWTGPCCRRSTQWKPTSSINPSEDGPRGPGLWTCWTWPARRRPQEEGAGCTPPSRPARRPAGGGPELGPQDLFLWNLTVGLTADPVMLLRPAPPHWTTFPEPPPATAPLIRAHP
ncbi:arf-GAP with dual PH domain-containing protein 1 isoform X2 [Phacochoerus africanus]|uniref:arf-GAP with dual PH domain-containing protein 1 isoform X2 n=1 Tax=Phacochoerus africanus TaxID=41426 RepID=UPI001FDA263C|nr:arf-GAP with dual PH domain-containing protein 1 isoform X2 [Phacochoerus africanus]